MNNIHTIAMESNDEISENEEEILVYIEFEGLDGNVFSEKQLQLDIIGIDTEHPIMQINGKFYEGSYEDVIGTYMFFIKNENPVIDDFVFDIAPNFKYFAKTRKFLKMQRIFIKSRTEVLGDSENKQCIPNLHTLKQAGIPLRYQKKALSFWRSMRNNRLNALYSYLEKQRIRQQKKSQGIILESESDEDNPFAIYKHKEEICSPNKSVNIHVDSKKVLNSCNNQFDSKCVHLKESNDENSIASKDSCQKNLNEYKALSNSEFLASKDDDCHLVRSVKGYKTRLSQKKKSTVIRKRQKIELKTKHTLLKKDDILSFDTAENKVSNLEGKLDEWDKSNVTETFTSLEINKNENTERSNIDEIIIDQVDSKNSKIVKELKREAKMKEISQQLKTIAKEYLQLHTKVD